MQRSSFVHDGLHLSYLDSAPGERTRPVVLLMHGFPDCALMWRAQIAFLHEQGFRVLAPDMRGYGESAMAARVRDYRAASIIADAAALLDHLQIDTADVVGHDWGAVLAWMFAGYYPQRVRRLVVISVGHPTAYGRAGLDQKLAGWYTLFFQLRGICEWLLLGGGPVGTHSLLSTHPEVAEVQARMRQPGRLSAALAIYRANLWTVLFRRQPDVRADTLAIWSRGDRFLVESQMRDSERYVQGRWRFVPLDGGHWIPLEQPDRLNALLREHLLDGPAQ